MSGLWAADELGKNSIVQSPDNALSPGARSGAAGVLLGDGDGRGAHSGRAQFGRAVREARDVAARLFRRDDVALPHFLRAQSAFRQILEYARAGNHAARHLGNVFEGIPQDWQLKRIGAHLAPPQNLSECRRTTPEAVEFEGVLKELNGPRVHHLRLASALSGGISPAGVAIGPHHVGGNVFAIQSNFAQRGDLVVLPAGPAAYNVRD